MTKPFIVAVDFDGTIVQHAFPSIGAEIPGAVDWMQRWVRAGAKLILWTCRSDGCVHDGSPENENVLAQAVKWCLDRGIEFWGVNRNPEQDWTKSPKVYANIYVDDAALGCPLLDPCPTHTASAHDGRRSVARWDIIGPCVMSLIEGHSRA